MQDLSQSPRLPSPVPLRSRRNLCSAAAPGFWPQGPLLGSRTGEVYADAWHASTAMATSI
ncbi:hypothetical protein MC885_004448 [Smutsia gigantea]|nr:hypothetical protein MC885_004448 [Smutsia gigantea]